jgi:3-oxoacyl-[acyl-carrier protein] reductase
VIRFDGLAGKVAVVTGAGRGLGAEVSEMLASQGCHLSLVDIDSSGLAKVEEHLTAGGAAVSTHLVDLADVTSCLNVITATVERFGRLDILVNNAAILRAESLAAVTQASFDLTMAVNLRAPFFLSQAAFPTMRNGRYGRIINISSVAVRTGGSIEEFPYVASKGGLTALTKALALAGAPDSILVNSVLPAAVDTPMLTESFGEDILDAIRSRIPLRRLAHPREVASLVVWLASPASSFVTGATFDINGGWAMT